MTDLVIDIPGLPVPYARSGSLGKVRFTPAKQRKAMADLKIFAAQAMAGRPVLETPLHVEMLFSWPFPKSMSNRKRADPRYHWRPARPDVDNLAKLVGDALSGIVWRDDALIVRCSVWKVLGNCAMTRITVRDAGLYNYDYFALLARDFAAEVAG